MLRKEEADFTGPGETSEKGLDCNEAKLSRNVYGLGLGRGYQRGRVNFLAVSTASKIEKDLLQEQKDS